MHDRLVALALANEAHLLAFVRARDDIFLNPKRVKDMRLPLPEQLGHYLRSERPSVHELAEIERALITGEVDGDDDEGDDTGVTILIEHWRDDPIQAWATALMAEAKGTAGDCVLTADGRCVGPLPVRQWLEQHVPLAVGLLQRSIAAAHTADEPLPPNVAVSQATQVAGRLATRINDELTLAASGSAAPGIGRADVGCPASVRRARSKPMMSWSIMAGAVRRSVRCPAPSRWGWRRRRPDSG